MNHLKDNIAIVAMSGGVDSSVAAAVAKSKYSKVIGVTLKLFDSEEADESIEDARRVAGFLEIEHNVIDCRQLFHERVIDAFIRDYELGLTPNPCAICNPNVKFRVLYETTQLRYPFFRIITGHYARITHDNERVLLRKAIDPKKDQSYFLYRINRDVLYLTEFPLGEMYKTDVVNMSKDFNLPLKKKEESQDVCFVGNCGYKDFLNDYIDSRSGDIVDESGNVLGKHKGIYRYTIGQRKGLGVCGGIFFVQSIDAERGLVIVGKEAPRHCGVKIKDVVWINEEYKGDCWIKIRSSKPAKYGKICVLDSNKVNVLFAEPERSIAKGQHAVFYDESDAVIGGGIIYGVFS